jgi:hypothetical protein
VEADVKKCWSKCRWLLGIWAIVSHTAASEHGHCRFLQHACFSASYHVLSPGDGDFNTSLLLSLSSIELPTGNIVSVNLIGTQLAFLHQNWAELHVVLMNSLAVCPKLDLLVTAP